MFGLKERISTLFASPIEKELDALAKAYFEADKFTGALLVARGDKILLRKAYGLARREPKTPATPEMRFRIGSMTKPFTAILIMQWVEAGRLSIEDTLDRYLPDYPHGQSITLRHLLSNTSGIPDYILMPEYTALSTRRVGLHDLIALFREQPLDFEPGTAFGYSNSNWVLLTAILESVTGQRYGDLLRTRIFEPAGMTHTDADWGMLGGFPEAVGTIDTGVHLIDADVIDASTMVGAGAIASTVDDLFRWARALRTNALLRDETFAAMLHPTFEQYGFGWELPTIHGRQAVGHSGGIPGFVGNFLRIDDVGGEVTVIVLSNLGSAAFSPLTEGLAAVVLGAPYEKPARYTFVAVDPALLADYAGVFDVTFFGRTFRLTFALEGERLTMDVAGLPKAALSALSETKFYARSKGDAEMQFVRDADGSVNRIEMDWAGWIGTAHRVR